MDKKNNNNGNMKQALSEMFGVGAEPVGKEGGRRLQEKSPAPAPVKVVERPAPAEKKPVSYLAPGTFLEGTLRSDGDVEIAGQFKGDITTSGTVVLHSSIEGNVSARSLRLSNCSLTGDVVAQEGVAVSRGCTIRGNVVAREVQCGGQITGDLQASDNITLESTAKIVGNIVTGSISVVRGAVIKGTIEIKTADISEG